MHLRKYQIADKNDSRTLAEFLAKDGQGLLPMVELLCQAEMAVDELIDVAGRAAIEAVLTLSAQQVAGPKHPGKAAGQITWYGRQKATIPLAERKLRIDKPRLRRKGQGPDKEVPLPAYEAMLTDAPLGRRMLEILMNGISTRRYHKVLPTMAETVGVSKSAVSRQGIEASAQTLKDLCERRFDDQDILIVYLDGIQFGQIHVIVALGVDREGHKHVLGLREGATENAVVAKDLLTDVVARGLDPNRKRLFVIDGGKALRAAIDEVFGDKNSIQRCRNHKIRNVLEYLPKDRHENIRSALKAAFLLSADKGTAKLRKLAQWLEHEYPSAASSLLEGLEEMFTINRLELPSDLRRCLATTNVIESPNAGIRQRTGRVTHWRDGQMVLRWTAAALLSMEKRMRRIMGYQQLWILEAKLQQDDLQQELVQELKRA